MSYEKNPWLSITKNPKATIRTIVQDKPRFRFWSLSSIYGIASGFFIANFYSLGFAHSFSSVLLSILLLSPFAGSAILLFDALLLRAIGILFDGKASYEHLLASVAWSKVPYLISLGFWFILAEIDPSKVFVNFAFPGSSALILVICSAVNIWSFFLLVQSAGELQGFRFLRSFCYVLFVSILSFVVTFTLLFVLRFVYISII